ncbi:hypothetical protein [Pseudomonas fluorescens]|uniref:hypothetical protein n=1 Tax=Pseudomonas fluorescens TaxID=294 RepID=UPI001241FAAE|nr:hypothetical protein [Pseudomonas fluorescens]
MKMQAPLKPFADLQGLFAGKPAPTVVYVFTNIAFTEDSCRDGTSSSTTNPGDLHFTDDGCALNPQNATIPEIINDIARGRCR